MGESQRFGERCPGRRIRGSLRLRPGRAAAYFGDGCRRNGSAFFIPYNRQQLADYLGVDRSAMCSELSRMRREGLIEYEKNRFVLIR